MESIRFGINCIWEVKEREKLKCSQVSGLESLRGGDRKTVLGPTGLVRGCCAHANLRCMWEDSG